LCLSGLRLPWLLPGSLLARLLLPLAWLAVTGLVPLALPAVAQLLPRA
jgi:hypothetical protein